jgi:hypothetical protein
VADKENQSNKFPYVLTKHFYNVSHKKYIDMPNKLLYTHEKDRTEIGVNHPIIIDISQLIDDFGFGLNRENSYHI